MSVFLVSLARGNPISTIIENNFWPFLNIYIKRYLCFVDTQRPCVTNKVLCSQQIDEHEQRGPDTFTHPLVLGNSGHTLETRTCLVVTAKLALYFLLATAAQIAISLCSCLQDECSVHQDSTCRLLCFSYCCPCIRSWLRYHGLWVVAVYITIIYFVTITQVERFFCSYCLHVRFHKAPEVTHHKWRLSKMARPVHL